MFDMRVRELEWTRPSDPAEVGFGTNRKVVSFATTGFGRYEIIHRKTYFQWAWCLGWPHVPDEAVVVYGPRDETLRAAEYHAMEDWRERVSRELNYYS